MIKMELRDETSEKTRDSGKERWKHLGLEYIQHEQIPKEGINQLDATRLRIMFCVSFTN